MYLKGWKKEDRSRLVLIVCSDRTRELDINCDRGSSIWLLYCRGDGGVAGSCQTYSKVHAAALASVLAAPFWGSEVLSLQCFYQAAGILFESYLFVPFVIVHNLNPSQLQ